MRAQPNLYLFKEEVVRLQKVVARNPEAVERWQKDRAPAFYSKS